MRGNSHVRFGGRPRGKGLSQAPRRAADPTAGEGRPVVLPEDHAATSGRGLRLIAEFAGGCWGVRPLVEGGKAVWAKLPGPGVPQ
ncbi:hypothetical protein [Actinomadura nitritigenes]|uniref:hypothetical protein n=1 Tax=Actinomadura nitritigenes TaxID=134602 RepID=UPI003D9062BF